MDPILSTVRERRGKVDVVLEVGRKFKLQVTPENMQDSEKMWTVRFENLRLDEVA